MFNNKILLLMGVVFAMNADAAERSVAVSSAELNVTNAKTDVLGRHNSKVRNTPQAYVKGVKKSVNQNFLAKAADYPSEKSMEKTSGVFEYRSNDKGAMVKTYFLNGDKYDESEYLRLIQNIEDKDAPRKAFKDSYFSIYNKVIKDNSKSVTGFSVTKTTDESAGKESYKNNQVDEYYVFKNYVTVVKNSNLYKYFIQPGGRGKNIGISFTENDLPLPALGIDFVKLGNYNL